MVNPEDLDIDRTEACADVRCGRCYGALEMWGVTDEHGSTATTVCPRCLFRSPFERR